MVPSIAYIFIQFTNHKSYTHPQAHYALINPKSFLTSGNSLSGGKEWELRVGVVGGVASICSAAAMSFPCSALSSTLWSLAWGKRSSVCVWYRIWVLCLLVCTITQIIRKYMWLCVGERETGYVMWSYSCTNLWTYLVFLQRQLSVEMLKVNQSHLAVSGSM